MLQVGRWWVRFPMRSLDFSIDLMFPAAIWPRGSTQPLTEMGTRDLPGRKGRPARKVDNLTAICVPTVQNVGASTSRNPMASAACYRDSFTFTIRFYNSRLAIEIRKSLCYKNQIKHCCCRQFQWWFGMFPVETRSIKAIPNKNNANILCILLVSLKSKSNWW
jgi:hypothetical protein